jgi:hypothetical protein
MVSFSRKKASVGSKYVFENSRRLGASINGIFSNQTTSTMSVMQESAETKHKSPSEDIKTVVQTGDVGSNSEGSCIVSPADEIYIDPVLQQKIFRKFDKFALPQLFLFAFLCYLDRSNLGLFSLPFSVARLTSFLIVSKEMQRSSV